eukprot:sb/3460699/
MRDDTSNRVQYLVYQSLPELKRTDEVDSIIRKMIGKHIRNAKYRAKCKLVSLPNSRANSGNGHTFGSFHCRLDVTRGDRHTIGIARQNSQREYRPQKLIKTGFARHDINNSLSPSQIVCSKLEEPITQPPASEPKIEEEEIKPRVSGGLDQRSVRRINPALQFSLANLRFSGTQPIPCTSSSSRDIPPQSLERSRDREIPPLVTQPPPPPPLPVPVSLPCLRNEVPNSLPFSPGNTRSITDSRVRAPPPVSLPFSSPGKTRARAPDGVNQGLNPAIQCFTKPERGLFFPRPGEGRRPSPGCLLQKGIGCTTKTQGFVLYCLSDIYNPKCLSRLHVRNERLAGKHSIMKHNAFILVDCGPKKTKIKIPKEKIPEEEKEEQPVTQPEAADTSKQKGIGCTTKTQGFVLYCLSDIYNPKCLSRLHVRNERLAGKHSIMKHNAFILVDCVGPQFTGMLGGNEFNCPKKTKIKIPKEKIPEEEKEEQPVTQPEAADTSKKTKARFILFVGNLPYTVTKENLEKHFGKVAMCIIFLASSPHLPHGLKALIAFNRDEVKSRTTLPAHRWEDSTIIGGTDASGRGVSNGTWLGLDTVSGRFGALLNVHSRTAGIIFDPNKAPRGGLVPGFLNTTTTPSTYVEESIGVESNFNCFNLVMGELMGDQPSFSVYDYHSSTLTPLSNEEVTVLGNLPPTASFTNPRAVYGQARFIEMLKKLEGLDFGAISERDARLEELVFGFLLGDTTEIQCTTKTQGFVLYCLSDIYNPKCLSRLHVRNERLAGKHSIMKHNAFILVDCVGPQFTGMLGGNEFNCPKKTKIKIPKEKIPEEEKEEQPVTQPEAADTSKKTKARFILFVGNQCETENWVMKRSKKDKVVRPDRPEYLQVSYNDNNMLKFHSNKSPSSIYPLPPPPYFIYLAAPYPNLILRRAPDSISSPDPSLAMCIIFLASSPQLPHGLKALIAFNRDEVKSRATLPAHRWKDSTIIGGTDASGRGVSNGTWLGLDTVSGRFGALLNVHSRTAGIVYDPNKAPRGGLVPGFLNTTTTPSTYVEESIGLESNFNCFNLVMGELTGDQPSFSVYDYHSGSLKPLSNEEVTVLGNLPPTKSFTNPRAVYGQARFIEMLKKFEGLDFGAISERDKQLEELVFGFLLGDTTDIPVGDTGLHGSFKHLFNEGYTVGEWECGTVSSTMISVDIDNRCRMVEWTHLPEKREALVTEFSGSTDEDTKLQIAANLANFSYNPINHGYLLQLNICDLFLDILDDPSSSVLLRRFAVGGLANVSVNREFLGLISPQLPLIEDLLSGTCDTETIVSALTLLYYIHRFAVGGLANVSVNREFLGLISPHLPLIEDLLRGTCDTETIVSALTLLYYIHRFLKLVFPCRVPGGVAATLPATPLLESLEGKCGAESRPRRSRTVGSEMQMKQEELESPKKKYRLKSVMCLRPVWRSHENCGQSIGLTRPFDSQMRSDGVGGARQFEKGLDYGPVSPTNGSETISNIHHQLLSWDFLILLASFASHYQRYATSAESHRSQSLTAQKSHRRHTEVGCSVINMPTRGLTLGRLSAPHFPSRLSRRVVGGKVAAAPGAHENCGQSIGLTRPFDSQMRSDGVGGARQFEKGLDYRPFQTLPGVYVAKMSPSMQYALSLSEHWPDPLLASLKERELWSEYWPDRVCSTTSTSDNIFQFCHRTPVYRESESSGEAILPGKSGSDCIKIVVLQQKMSRNRPNQKILHWSLIG